FKCRGPDYLSTGVKVPSEEAAFTLLGVDLLLCDSEVKNLCARKGGFVQRLHKFPPWVLSFHFALPWGSFAAYFGRKGADGALLPTPYTGDGGRLDRLIRSFVEGDDAFRNERLKIVPSCPEGPWLVRHAVKGKPGCSAPSWP
ncbi:unnamed protein product, partial [Phaeothamnion confervicola]